MPRIENKEQIDEVGELIAVLFASAPERLTACRGWTAHELVAHLAAGAAEEADLIEEHMAGAERATRGFAEREQPFRDLPDAALRDRLVGEAARLSVALDTLARLGSEEDVHFTGRSMTAADFTMHSRSECALHRWDLVGRDDIGWAMLAQPCLTEHALGVLTSMSTLPEAPANRLGKYRNQGHELRLVIRSAPDDDIVLTVADDAVAICLRPIDDSVADVELDAAARLLGLWGRREPSASIHLHAEGIARTILTTLFGW